MLSIVFQFPAGLCRDEVAKSSRLHLWSRVSVDHRLRYLISSGLWVHVLALTSAQSGLWTVSQLSVSFVGHKNVIVCASLFATRTSCGVTWEPLTDYWPWAIAHMSLSKMWWDVGPKLKYWMTALSTQGCVLASPWAQASNSTSLRCFDIKSWVGLFLQVKLADHVCAWTPWQSKREGKPQVMWSPLGGGNAG